MSADVNDHEIWRERAALYALGALTGDERVSFETHLHASLETEGHFQALATTSPDIVEGMAAFREKRDAQFDGT